MSFDGIVYFHLLWISFIVFFLGLFIKLIAFLTAFFTHIRHLKLSTKNIFLYPISLSVFPFKGLLKLPPVKAVPHYIFHIALLIVPIGLGSHIVLWESSRFQISWMQLPDIVADILTIFCLGMLSALLVRRFYLFIQYKYGKLTDFLIPLLLVIIFSSGFLLSHDLFYFDFVIFNRLDIIHVFTSELFLLLIPFSFLKLTVDSAKCTSCASCQLACPASAIKITYDESLISFWHKHAQCISCGICIVTCPERAVAFKHTLEFRRFFFVLFGFYRIHKADMSACPGCGAFFTPSPLLERVAMRAEHEHMIYCPDCRLHISASLLGRLPSPLDSSFKGPIHRGRLHHGGERPAG